MRYTAIHLQGILLTLDTYDEVLDFIGQKPTIFCSHQAPCTTHFNPGAIVTRKEEE